ncbi:TIGR03085 family metal-binding protein [Krasilnikovia sp. MM14-A1259]|uniref:TIGR03085 family metal-binding protein n=1 Tax=Krasilnikovia sp. MM14-A1259 TaxID=3373539 RepID=UPI0038102695
MSDYAQRERAAVADLLLQVGPDAPTLCAGWTTRDLAAHLVIRERRPDSGAGIVVPRFAAYTERIRTAKAAQPYERVVEEVRNPPWWSPVSNPLTDELANTVEFFIHHEDIRRAGSGWTPRTLDEGERQALWRTARLTARLRLRRLGMPVLVVAPGVGEQRVGAPSAGSPAVVLSGEPGELVMFLSGRQRAARVQVDGPDAAADRLRTARLGM